MLLSKYCNLDHVVCNISVILDSNSISLYFMIEITKKDIRSLSFEEVKESFIANGEKAFRAKQVFEWLWKKSATSFEEMTNLSLKTREWLSTYFVINAVTIESVQNSNDGTVKQNFKSAVLKIVTGDFNLLKLPVPYGHIWDSFMRVFL